jgi:hypothetical protein
MNADWRRVRDRITSTWSDADFDAKEMKRARGSLTEMVSVVHNTTGEARPSVRRKIVSMI